MRLNPLKQFPFKKINKSVSRPKRSDKKYGRISAILTCISAPSSSSGATVDLTAFAAPVHRTARRRLTYPNLGRAGRGRQREKARESAPPILSLSSCLAAHLLLARLGRQQQLVCLSFCSSSPCEYNNRIPYSLSFLAMLKN